MRYITLFIWLTATSLTAAAARPNVVFIMADDLGYGDFSCYGARHFETPAADRLADEGLRFTDAHSPSAVCTPSRYAVLTGRYAWRSWLKNWVVMENHPLMIDTERVTMGDLFRQAGYVSGFIGKWHLGWGTELNTSFNGEVKPGPVQVGFDSFFGVPYSHNSSKRLQVFMRDMQIEGLKPGLDYRSEEAKADTVRELEATATRLSEEAVAFVDRHKDEPFFLFYSTTNIHYPLTPHERFQGAGRAGVYGDFVVEFDWAVGQLLEALDRNGLAENTLVVLTSDNGARPHEDLAGHACNGPWRGTKRLIYEAGHRVPLIVRWPGKVPAGAETDQTVCLTDFFATFASIINQPFPVDAGEDSYDISPVLLGAAGKAPVRGPVVHHSMVGQFALRDGDWKLIEGSGDGDFPKNEQGKIDVKRWRPTRDPISGEWLEMDYFDWVPDDQYQLYNMAGDPVEFNNVAEVFPARVQAMARQLEAIRERKRSAPYPGE